MPRFDPDLIAALAEGSVDGERAAALEREIAADPAAAAELRAHRTALELIRGTQPAAMTADERTLLRSTVAEQLGLATEEAVEPAVPRRAPWGSLAVAAAALFGVVAIVPVVGLLSTGGTEANSDLAGVAFEDAGETTTTFAESSAEPDTTESVPAAAVDSTPTSAAAASTEELAAAAPEASDEDGQARIDTTVTTGGSGASEDGSTTGGDDTTTSTDATTTTTVLVRTDEEELGLLRGEPGTVESLGFEASTESRCYAEALAAIGVVEEGGRMVGLEHSFSSGDGLAFFNVNADGSFGGAAAFHPEDCSLIAVLS